MFFLSKTSKRRLVERLEAVENQLKTLLEEMTDLQDRTTRRYSRMIKRMERDDAERVNPRSTEPSVPLPPSTDPVSEMILRRRRSVMARLPTDGEGS